MTRSLARRWAAAAAMTACLASCACGGRREADPVVAEVGGAPVRLSVLERYLAQNVPEGADAEPATPEEESQMKSRLLDDLLDEERLAAEAERRGISVRPDELAAYLRDTAPAEGPSPSPAPPPGPGRESDARRELLAQKLRESVAAASEPVTSEEADAYLQANRAALEAEGVPADPSRAEAVLHQRARERLALERGEATNEKLLEALRGRMPSVLHRERIPFPYREATP